MARRLTDKHSALAFVLNKEMGYSQTAIAQLMGVSQGTVSNMIREFDLKKQIYDLQTELNEARIIIQNKNLLPQNDTYFVE